MNKKAEETTISETTALRRGATQGTQARPCNVLTYLPMGNPQGVRTSTIRGRPCRLSVAPPGSTGELRRFEISGPVIAIVWREGDREPSLTVLAELDSLKNRLDEIGHEVSVALVSSDQDFTPARAFQVLAEALAAKAGATWDRTVAVDEESRCFGEEMVETASILLGMNRVPGF